MNPAERTKTAGAVAQIIALPVGVFGFLAAASAVIAIAGGGDFREHGPDLFGGAAVWAVGFQLFRAGTRALR